MKDAVTVFPGSAPHGTLEERKIMPETNDNKPLEDDAVGIEAFDDSELLDPEPQQTPAEPAPKTKKTKRGYTKLELVLVVLLAIAVVIIVRQSGIQNSETQLPKNHPDISSMHGKATSKAKKPGVTLNDGKVGELKKKIEANPQDIDSHKDLGKEYFDAGYYQDANTYFGRALELSPDDLETLLMAGVSEFNVNNFDAAEKHWTHATEVDATKPEPWFNLGYVYLMREPKDEAGLKRAWDKVLELAPDSDMAKAVKEYRQSAPGPVTGSDSKH